MALKLEPKNASANWRLGKVVDAEGDGKEAAIYYERALSINPEFTDKIFEKDGVE